MCINKGFVNKERLMVTLCLARRCPSVTLENKIDKKFFFSRSLLSVRIDDVIIQIFEYVQSCCTCCRFLLLPLIIGQH